jgi:D-alanyl-D-alanine carboxypeptidase
MLEFYTNIQRISDPDDLTVLVDKFHQLDRCYVPCDLEEIDPLYNSGELLLRHEARLAFEVMCREAEFEGFHLEAISTYRSFDYQEKVYFKNLTQEVLLESYQAERDKVSARAGHSEHQTGLAVDINDLEKTFEAAPEGRWLANNSYRFGFILRYPQSKESITGYDFEPWHFRYLGKELAKAVWNSGLTYDEFIQNI